MSLSNLRINSKRLRADFDALSEIGATVGGGVRRLALSPEDLEARAWFVERAEALGLLIRDDEAGNLSGVLRSGDRGAKTLLIGSHLDSVPNGGQYDGTIGVIAGLECIRVIQEAGIALPVHLEVIDFTDEEGAWKGLFGSSALAGQLSPAYLAEMREDSGAFRAALYRAGIRPEEVLRACRKPKDLLAYLELHIEQGPRLDRAGLQLGVVDGIIGRSTYQVIFTGQGAHSGTTDPEARRDALQGAAQFILDGHNLLHNGFGEGVFNCGNISVQPGAFNIIPAKAMLTVEVRHINEQMLMDMENTLLTRAREVAERYGLTVQAERVVHVPAAPMDKHVVETVETVCSELGLTHTRLRSYAGHDAQMLSTITPSAMIFVPSTNGISHNPREYTPWEDVENGANVLLHTALRLALRGGV